MVEMEQRHHQKNHFWNLILEWKIGFYHNYLDKLFGLKN